MDTAAFFWQEEIPKGSIRQTTLNGTPDTISETMTILINWDDLEDCLIHVLGYSSVSGVAQAGYTGSRQLHRFLPARHPRYKWLRASSVSVVGRNPFTKRTTGPELETGDTDANGNDLTAPAGTYGRWVTAAVTITFTAPKYPIYADSEITNEYDRYVTKTYKPNLETLTRRGEPWKYLDAAVKAIPMTEHVGDVLVKAPKGILQWTWHQVPETWLMLGGIYPSNLARAVGTVNLKPFPYSGAVTNPSTGLPVQFGAGTLLFLPPEIEPTSQITPALLNTELTGMITFPRTYDVKMQFLHFDPPADAATALATANVNGQIILIRGHNLVPLPRAINGYRWFASARGVDVFPVDHAALAYQYSDFEKIFKYAE